MSSRYIIFADDDADDLELITGFFKEFTRELTVLEFKDGKEVVKFLDEFATATNPPDLIVLDINMPRMNGKETLVHIRNHPRFGNVPVMIYTTSVNEADEVFCEQHRASWIFKPTRIDEVKAVACILAEFCQNSP